MIRLITGIGICFGLVFAATFAALSVPTDAQDSTAGRLSAVETEVAGQATQISGLHKRVKRLEQVVLTPEATTASESATNAEPRTSATLPTISGARATVSEKFNLETGRYKVTATLQIGDFSGFICQLYGPGIFDDYLFNELIDTPGTWTGSTVIQIPVSGEFFVQVPNTDAAWQLTFEEF
jgi:hypothetical protein